MAPVMKRQKVDAVGNRCKLIKSAIKGAEACPARVKDMLSSTLTVTVGDLKANRHPFNERFVAMIGEVLKAQHTHLTQDVKNKEAAFAATSPAKANREAALEQAKASSAAKAEASSNAKNAVTEIAATLKQAKEALKEAEKAQKAGDAELETVSIKKTMLEETQQDSLAPLLDGSATAEDKSKKTKAVLDVGQSFNFDASLLATAEPVLLKDNAERGSFDGTCLEKLSAAFAGAIAELNGQLAAAAPSKAARAGAAQAAEAAKQAAEASQSDLKERAQAAKDAKAAADAAERAASQNLADFMPDLKKAGDALDKAKDDLTKFLEGAVKAFQELKDVKEGDFEAEINPPSYYQQVDGMKLDRQVIESCATSVAGVGDGRVSVDDAKKVFEAVADGNKVTKCERWTVRYCLQEYNWTEAAHDWLIEAMKSAQEGGSPAKKARTGTGYYETIDGFKCDRGIIDACREAAVGQGDGRVSEDDAKKVWEKAADGNKVTHAEKWTLRYCLSEFKWTRPAHDWIMTQLKAV